MRRSDFERLVVLRLSLLAALVGMDPRRLRRLLAADGVRVRCVGVGRGSRHTVDRCEIARAMPGFYAGLCERILTSSESDMEPPTESR